MKIDFGEILWSTLSENQYLLKHKDNKSIFNKWYLYEKNLYDVKNVFVKIDFYVWRKKKEEYYSFDSSLRKTRKKCAPGYYPSKILIEVRIETIAYFFFFVRLAAMLHRVWFYLSEK